MRPSPDFLSQHVRYRVRADSAGEWHPTNPGQHERDRVGVLDCGAGLPQRETPARRRPAERWVDQDSWLHKSSSAVLQDALTNRAGHT